VNQRADNYGDPAFNFRMIALFWATIDDFKRHEGVTVEETIWKMLLLKISRCVHSYNEDTYIDIIGYVLALQKIINKYGIEAVRTPISKMDGRIYNAIMNEIEKTGGA
jgi:hypothetical protein